MTVLRRAAVGLRKALAQLACFCRACIRCVCEVRTWQFVSILVGGCVSCDAMRLRQKREVDMSWVLVHHLSSVAQTSPMPTVCFPHSVVVLQNLKGMHTSNTKHILSAHEALILLAGVNTDILHNTACCMVTFQ
jgi:hypothetical protein